MVLNLFFIFSFRFFVISIAYRSLSLTEKSCMETFVLTVQLDPNDSRVFGYWVLSTKCSAW